MKSMVAVKYYANCMRWFVSSHLRFRASNSLVAVKYMSICIARFFRKAFEMRSDIDHTVLPANYTMPAFTPQPQNITALWLVLILPSHGG